MSHSKSQAALFDDISMGAELSHDRVYRYTLWRIWDSNKPFVLFIGLNPSTADEYKDDQTIRRCLGFAKKWGYGGLYMANLFAFRATDPVEMKAHKAPVGPGNDEVLIRLSEQAGLVVCAWGAHGSHLSRNNDVYNLLNKYNLMCLDVTKHGHPRHPLYIKSDTELKRYVR